MAKSKNPLGGILSDGSSSSGTGWNSMDPHSQRVYWGRINDIYQKWLGRNATEAEVRGVYGSGLSGYGLMQKLVSSKEFIGSQMYKQQSQMYHYIIGQFFGAGFKMTPKMIQSWTAHGYNQSDVQAWIYRHPHIYMQSNDFKDRVANFHQTFVSVMGFDPSQAERRVTTPGAPAKPTNKGAASKPGLNPNPSPIGAPPVAGRPGGPGGAPPPPPPLGSGAPPPPAPLATGAGAKGAARGSTSKVVDPYSHHLTQAALHFQTAAQYADYLRSTNAYRQNLLYGGVHAGGYDATASTAGGNFIQAGLFGGRPGLSGQNADTAA